MAVAATAIAGVLLTAAGCGGEQTPPPGAVESAVRGVFDAYNAKDRRAYADGFTERGFRAVAGVSKREAEHLTPGLNGVASFMQTRVAVGQIGGTTVSGATARTRVTFTITHVRKTFALTLVASGGRWLIDGWREAPPTAGGGEAIAVTQREYAIRMRPRTLAPDAVLGVRNAGREPHELLLLHLRSDSTEWSLGRVGPVAPGRSWSLAVTGLDPGRYALVCNLLGPDGRPHSAKGMRRIFTVR